MTTVTDIGMRRWTWYQRAHVCYVYLSDIGPAQSDNGITTKNIDLTKNVDGQHTQSDWFRRGWTLQELLGASAFCPHFVVRMLLTCQPPTILSFSPVTGAPSAPCAKAISVGTASSRSGCRGIPASPSNSLMERPD